MGFYAFRLLSPVVQLLWVIQHGTYPARRWEEGDGVNRYRLPGGFFAERYHDPHANERVRLRSCSSAAPLEDYAARIRLPAGL